MASPIESLLSTNIAALILSWVLIFTVMYAALLKSKALGEDHRIIAVISAVVGFFTVGLGASMLGQFFQSIFSGMALVVGGILVAILLLAMSGADVSKVLGAGKISAVLIIVAVALFLAAAGAVGRGISGDLLSTVIILIVLGIAVIFVTGK
ncbi:MAG: hypothetical protein HYT72_01970 [Candidatus Aenigmarchaeota archaeon]|nr:hypothetical protein [Candidatus Aenigmarchaeota archaeon]